MEPTRAVIYTRVSSDRDGEGRSVGQQEAACRDECARRGWDVVEILSDNDRSATRYARKGRPEYERLRGLLADGKADLLVTWEASRAQRDLAAYATLRDLCAQQGVKWSYSGRLYDLRDADDRFATGIDALVGEREADLTRKRILRDVEARAMTGRGHGVAHDGYLVEYDPRTGRPVRRVLDPDRAPILREAVDRVLAGESAYSIAKDFTARGIRTSRGGQWTGANLVKRLQSPTLAGLRVFRGTVLADVKADWEPLITVEEHHRLLAIFADPARASNRQGTTVKWVGTGVYRCGVCDTPVRMISGLRPDGSRRVRYACKVAHVQRAAGPVDTLVEKALITYLSRSDVLADLTAAESDADAAQAASEAAVLHQELAGARRMVTEGVISLDDFAAFRAGWEPKLRAAEERARPKWLPTSVYEVAGPDAASRWAATPVQQRRAIVKALLIVRIHPQGRRGNQHGGTFDPAAVTVERRHP